MGGCAKWGCTDLSSNLHLRLSLKLAECLVLFNAGWQDISVPLRRGTLPICQVNIDLAKMSMSGRLGVESMAGSDEADTFAMPDKDLKT